jgi:hypothetical protein
MQKLYVYIYKLPLSLLLSLVTCRRHLFPVLLSYAASHASVLTRRRMSSLRRRHARELSDDVARVLYVKAPNFFYGRSHGSPAAYSAPSPPLPFDPLVYCILDATQLLLHRSRQKWTGVGAGELGGPSTAGAAWDRKACLAQAIYSGDDISLHHKVSLGIGSGVGRPPAHLRKR